VLDIQVTLYFIIHLLLQKSEVKIMKSIGIVRSVDQLGRIVIPSEMRRTMNIAPDDQMEIFVDENMIILKKFECSCIFCNGGDNLRGYKGKKVCSRCLADFRLPKLPSTEL
jgi:transcriptional pleiotropic regulator of transition state genes